MKVLVVVDMQNDFINGSLGSDEAVRIVSNVQQKIEQAHDEGAKIIFTRDTHKPNYLETLEGKNLPVVHCIEHTYGWEISNQLDTTHAKIINKHTFGSIELLKAMKAYNAEEKIKEIEFVGLCTDICVISNAMILKAGFLEANIIVDASCCAGVTKESHKNALEAMKVCQINVIGE